MLLIATISTVLVHKIGMNW